MGQGVLHYQEHGRTTFGNNKVLPGYRAYAYVYDQGTISVHFWDQEQRQPAGLLHTLQLHSTKTTSQVDDVDKACYTFVNRQYFQLTYQVQGLRKVIL